MGRDALRRVRMSPVRGSASFPYRRFTVRAVGASASSRAGGSSACCTRTIARACGGCRRRLRSGRGHIGRLPAAGGERRADREQRKEQGKRLFHSRIPFFGAKSFSVYIVHKPFCLDNAKSVESASAKVGFFAPRRVH